MPERNPKATCSTCWIGKPRADGAIICTATTPRPDRVKLPTGYCPWHPDYELKAKPEAKTAKRG